MASHESIYVCLMALAAQHGRMLDQCAWHECFRLKHCIVSCVSYSQFDRMQISCRGLLNEESMLRPLAC